ncbi:MAG: hypothetical protein Q9228_007613, partial [Teloschistes exilis]
MTSSCDNNPSSPYLSYHPSLSFSHGAAYNSIPQSMAPKRPFSPSLPSSTSPLSHPTNTTPAIHRITAWRFPSTQRALPSSSASRQERYETGHDDDGETHGGRALEAVLAEKNVTGVVVVARWYGGRMLGPVRFEHIKNCARDAIAGSLHQASSTQQDSKRAKTMAAGAVEGEKKKRRREELLRILAERD